MNLLGVKSPSNANKIALYWMVTFQANQIFVEEFDFKTHAG